MNPSLCYGESSAGEPGGQALVLTPLGSKLVAYTSHTNSWPEGVMGTPGNAAKLGFNL
jgi:hypothetical protein